MKLPGNSIGVTDLMSYYECARRFEHGMRRHTPAGESPEHNSPANAYGSSFHEAVAYIHEHGASDEEAITFVMAIPRYARWLSPDDLERLHVDLKTYRERDYVGVTPVMSERELRVPLMVHEGEQIYYRFKVDRLYRSQRDPGTFIHVDYKTSRHPKTKEEVDHDLQLGSYAWALRELFPEIERLVQIYDQLNFGAIPTMRTSEQLELVREWLISGAIAVLEDDVLEPTYNTFCAYCPILMDCPIIPQLTDYALAEIAGLLPEKNEDGKIIGPNGELLEGAALEPYVEMLDKVSRAKKILEAFDGRMKNTLRELPIGKRLAYGYKTSSPQVSTWPPEALQAIEEILGEDFYRLINLPKTAVERLPKDTQAIINGMAVQHRGAPRLTKVKPS